MRLKTYFNKRLAKINSRLTSDNNLLLVNSDIIQPHAFTAPHVKAEQASNGLTLAYVKPYYQTSLKMRIAKRTFDIAFSTTVMIIGLPIFMILLLLTKFSSPGPVFYKQERLGRHQRKFYIYKFRSMHVNAEAAGPQLSREDDPRITPWGRIIRRTRLDELPQFWNVLIGDMSVVGPRPEREFFINQIVTRNPDYRKLQWLKPGITSNGQVNFGYAENIDQMCTRMQYDLDYAQSMNLVTDLKVILKTLKVMVQCKGK